MSRAKGVEPSNRIVSEHAFTLLELLVVITMLGVLAALLLPVLSNTRASSQATVCKNHLSQTGRALAMYLADARHYPPCEEVELLGHGQGAFIRTWADRLYPYAPLAWTNLSWHCPTFIADGGLAFQKLIPPGGLSGRALSTSYAYNAFGIAGSGNRWPKLGLGNWKGRLSAEQELQAPSEMYAVADTRAYKEPRTGDLIGPPVMESWLGPGGAPGFVLGGETAAPHAQGYNVLFADAHVALVKRKDYLFPPRSAGHWNRDNNPHPELWAPTSQWPVQR